MLTDISRARCFAERRGTPTPRGLSGTRRCLCFLGSWLCRPMPWPMRWPTPRVSHMMADPFSASKNGINAESYLDLQVAGTARLIHDNEAHPVDSTQDPKFAMMASDDGQGNVGVPPRGSGCLHAICFMNFDKS